MTRTATPGTRRAARGLRAERALRDVLPRGARVRIDGGAPGEFEVRVNGTPFRVRWLGTGQLRDAERVLRARRPRNLVVAAPSLSPGARERLSGAGVGWLDESGAAELAVGPLVVSRSGRPAARAPAPLRWTPSVLAVAEALLCGAPATVSGAQDATGLSTGSCTHALRLLTDLGLLEAEVKRGRGAARRVLDADQMLEAYASAAAARRKGSALVVGVVWRDPVLGLAELGARWDRAGLAWAGTGAVAAAVLAPLLTAVGSVEVYVEADTMAGLERVAAEVGLRPIEGGRLTLRPFPTVCARRLASAAQGLRVAPWPRVYADLRQVGVRGEEAAEHLRSTVRGG